MGGLALGIGSGARGDKLVTILIGGLVGGFLGALVYELIGAFAFPMAGTTKPISETGTRAIARLAVAIFAAAGAAWGAGESRPGPSPG